MCGIHMCEPVASASAASSSRRSNASPESVSKFEMESVASTCSDVEMEAMNSEIESCDHESDPLLRLIKRTCGNQTQSAVIRKDDS